MKKIILIFMLSVILIITYYFQNNEINKLLYSTSSIRKIKKYNILDKVSKYDYSKTLDIALENDEFNINNLNGYLSIKYDNDKNIVNKINMLYKIGYDEELIKILFKRLSSYEIDYITNYTYIDNLSSYINYKIFKVENLDRYINYRNKNNNLNFKDIIIRVNLDLDKDYYDNPNIIKNPDDLLVLVNKHNKLPDNFIAKDIKQIDSKYTVSDLFLRKDAKESFEEMCSDAKSIGLFIKAVSAYRNNEYQEKLYNDYVLKNGLDNANTFSAKAGYSEHETGLSVDVQGGKLGYNLFHETEEYKWVKENAHKYGFIIRYEKEKEDVTGYKYESWHLRYVGNNVAKYIYKNGISFDEYYALFLNTEPMDNIYEK